MHLSSRVSEVATRTDVVRWPLPGGWVTTGWGAEVHRVTAAVAVLGRPVEVPV